MRRGVLAALALIAAGQGATQMKRKLLDAPILAVGVERHLTVEVPHRLNREADAFYKLACFDAAYRKKMAGALRQAGMPE